MHAFPVPLSALVAGHSPRDVRMVRLLLKRLGIARIDAVEDGKAAIERMEHNPPDLLVVDWDISASPADMVVKAARKAPEAGPRIVVTMGAPTQAAVEVAKGLAVDSVVAMPFSPRTFMDRVPRLDLLRKSAAPSRTDAAS